MHTTYRRPWRRGCASARLCRARRVWVDCASLGRRAIEQAVAVYGADRVVLGTDCPIFDTDRTLAGIRDASLSEAERELVLTRNAAALLERLA